MESNLPNDPPLTIRRGIAAFWVSAICHLLPVRLNVILNFPAALGSSPEARARLGQGAAVFVGMVMLAIALVLIWLVVRGISQQRNWARVVVLVVFILSLPFRIVWIFNEAELNWMGFGTLALLSLDCYVIVSLFVGTGRNWFKSKPTSVTSISAS